MIRAYRHVLVPTDFSKRGNAAIWDAYAVLGRGPGRVTLCHVVERPSTPNPLYAHYAPGPWQTPEQWQAVKARLVERLRKVVPQEAAARSRIRTELRVVDGEGDVHAQICRLARVLGADLIVIASRRHTGLARVLLGSVADRILGMIDLPVLVVRRSSNGRRPSRSTALRRGKNRRRGGSTVGPRVRR